MFRAKFAAVLALAVFLLAFSSVFSAYAQESWWQHPTSCPLKPTAEEILVAKGLISQEKVDELREKANNKGKFVIDLIAEKELVDKAEIAAAKRNGNYFYYGDYAQFGFEIHHTGIDIPCPVESPVFASASGQVYLVQQGWLGFGGWAIFIYHGQDAHGLPILSFYTHLKTVNVSGGDWVQAGQTIGTVGKHGTGPHLHWSYSNMFPEEFWTYEIHAWDNGGRGWNDPLSPPQLVLRINKNGDLVPVDESDDVSASTDQVGGGRDEVAVPFGAPEETKEEDQVNTSAAVPDISGGMLVGRVLGGNPAQPGVQVETSPTPFIIIGAIVLIFLGVLFFTMSRSFGF